MAEITTEARRQTLQNAIMMYVSQGYSITMQNDSSAQLKKPKKFNWLLFIVLLLIGGIGFIYLIYYFVQKEETIYLTIDANGNLQTNKQK